MVHRANCSDTKLIGDDNRTIGKLKYNYKKHGGLGKDY
jgi:hypothetical protein